MMSLLQSLSYQSLQINTEKILNKYKQLKAEQIKRIKHKESH